MHTRHTAGSRKFLVAVAGMDFIFGFLGIIGALILIQEGGFTLVIASIVALALVMAIDFWMLAGSRIGWFIRMGLEVLAIMGAILSFDIIGIAINALIMALLFRGQDHCQ